MDRTAEWDELRAPPPGARRTSGPTSSARGVHHLALLSPRRRADDRASTRTCSSSRSPSSSRTATTRARRTSSSTSATATCSRSSTSPASTSAPYAEVLGGLHHLAISVEPERWEHLQGRSSTTAGVPYEDDERLVDLLPRSRRRAARADRRPARRDVRHRGRLTGSASGVSSRRRGRRRCGAARHGRSGRGCRRRGRRRARGSGPPTRSCAARSRGSARPRAGCRPGAAPRGRRRSRRRGGGRFERGQTSVLSSTSVPRATFTNARPGASPRTRPRRRGSRSRRCRARPRPRRGRGGAWPSRSSGPISSSTAGSVIPGVYERLTPIVCTPNAAQPDRDRRADRADADDQCGAALEQRAERLGPLVPLLLGRVLVEPLVDLRAPGRPPTRRSGRPPMPAGLVSVMSPAGRFDATNWPTPEPIAWIHCSSGASRGRSSGAFSVSMIVGVGERGAEVVAEERLAARVDLLRGVTCRGGCARQW